MRGQRADQERALRLAHPGQAFHLPQIDEMRGLCETQLHQRNEALASGQHLRLVTVLAEKREGFRERRWRVILEGSGVHGFLLSGPAGPPRCVPE